MPGLTLVMRLPRFPEPHERYGIARHHLPELVQAWKEGLGKVPDEFTILIAHPGEIGSSMMKRTHIADEAAARVEGTDLVPVALHMSDDPVPEDLLSFLALRFRGKGY